jgi:glutamate formiminotransferase
MVRIEASRFGITVAESEVIGLVPMDAMIEVSKFYLQLNEFKTEQILEKKVWGE